MSVSSFASSSDLKERLIDDLMVDDLRVSPDISLAEIAALFAGDSRMSAVPVVEEGRVIGVVELKALLARLTNSGPVRTVTARDLMHRDFSSLYAGETLQVSFGKLELLEQMGSPPDMVLLTDSKGLYQGRLQVLDIYRAHTRQKTLQKRYHNPLTGLPGQVLIDERIDELLARKSLFVLTQWDINGLKAFNDVHGYERGDKIIRQFSKLLQKQVNPALDEIGHFGGDDFVVIFRSPDWFELCEEIQSKFEAAVLKDFVSGNPSGFLTDFHVGDGAAQKNNRMTLSVGAVQVEPGKFPRHSTVKQALQEVNLRARAITGGGFFIDDSFYRCHATQRPLLQN